MPAFSDRLGAWWHRAIGHRLHLYPSHPDGVQIDGQCFVGARCLQCDELTDVRAVSEATMLQVRDFPRVRVGHS